ncbi:Cytochrome c oxidase polypeptide II [hydrothermal vent metagenome]|uniref:cytochrome-c oxidase n=1 Tax=hydrothermal vent metagenome TaxID=652676 RepID=A0A3B0TDS1_9ZZZZ
MGTQVRKNAITAACRLLGGLAVGLVGAAGPALAENTEGLAKPWQLGFQDAVTSVMTDITWFHNDILVPIITVITLFVLALLIWVVVRYNERANPVPSKTTHNTTIEVVWTVVPILILAVIAVPSFKILTEQRTIPDADLTIKVVGYQWYWSYEYPDLDGISFDSVMLEDNELQPGQHRLLEVDNRVVVPVNTTVRLVLTAADVIHSWAIPAFGVKIDTIPGRLNEAWFRAEKTGTYYGQCSELCGIRHAFMPIAVDVVSTEEWEAWQVKAKQEFAASPDKSTARRLALAAE